MADTLSICPTCPNIPSEPAQTKQEMLEIEALLDSFAMQARELQVFSICMRAPKTQNSREIRDYVIYGTSNYLKQDLVMIKKSSSFRECSPKFLERKAFSGRFLKKPQSSPIFSCKALDNFDETSYISYRNKIYFSLLSSNKKTPILVFSLMGQPGSNKVYYRWMDWSICLSVCFLSAMDCYADLCFTCLMFSLTSFGPPWGPFFHSTGRSSGP